MLPIQKLRLIRKYYSKRHVSETVKKRDTKQFSPSFSGITEFFDLLSAGVKIVDLGELKKQVVEVLPFDQPGWTKILAESSIFWWCDKRKDIENKSNTWTACMSSGEK